MKSISGNYWEELKSTQRLIDKIKIDHNFSMIQAKMIISRNFSEEEIFSINNNVEITNPFLKKKDFLLGCELLKKHIDKRNKILIIGDYDVDGCVSTSLMVNFLKKNKAKVTYYIPDRVKDGYGANKELIIKLLLKYNPRLIVFLDCGSNSYKALNFIKSKKIDSFIIDHHNTQEPYPLTNIFINPKKNNGYKNYEYLCTTFLVYLFIDLYIKNNQLKFSIKHEQIYVLLATVADVMPIRDLNRTLAINVLKNFKVNTNLIFETLFTYFNLKRKLKLEDLGFLIAPIFNSAGRLDNANQIVDLLTTNSNYNKLSIIKKIYILNKKRKFIEEQCINELNFKDIFNQKGVLFIYKSGINEGIIGIIASRIKDYYKKPCIVLTNSNNIIKGSARSTSDFNIGEYIQKALNEKILLSGGGHNLAAGVSLLKSKINNFKKFLDNYYEKIDHKQKNYYISKISLNAVNKDFLKDINIIGPFGHKNSSPIFYINNVKILKPIILKGKYVSFYVKANNKMVKAISFNHLKTKISYEILNSKNTLDILVKIKENDWKNKSSVQLQVVDLISNTNKT